MTSVPVRRASTQNAPAGEVRRLFVKALHLGTMVWQLEPQKIASQTLNSKELQQLAIRLAVLRSIIKEPYRPNLRWAAAVLSNHP
jgi:hypothetical protein